MTSNHSTPISGKGPGVTSALARHVAGLGPSALIMPNPDVRQHACVLS